MKSYEIDKRIEDTYGIIEVYINYPEYPNKEYALCIVLQDQLKRLENLELTHDSVGLRGDIRGKSGKACLEIRYPYDRYNEMIVEDVIDRDMKRIKEFIDQNRHKFMDNIK